MKHIPPKSLTHRAITSFRIGALLAIVLYALTSEAQPLSENTSATIIGIEPGGSLNQHTTQQQFIPSYESCGSFSNGSGVGFSGSVFFRRILNKTFGLRFSGGYQDLSGTMNDLSLTAGRENYNGNPLQIVTQEKLKSTIRTAGITALVQWRSPMNVDFSFGGNLSYTLQQTYYQTEEIVSPVGETYITGGSTRELGAGDITPRKQILVSPVVSASIDFRKGNFLFTPALYLGTPLNALRNDVHWRIAALTLGLGLGYQFPESREPLSPPPPPPPPPQPLPVVIASPVHIHVLDAVLDLKGISEENDIIEAPKIGIHRTDIHEEFPLVAAVFFDEGSSEIPARYNRITSESERALFSTDEIPDVDALKISHHILNIVGQRLEQLPRSRITVTGATSNVREEAHNISLAERRAGAVKQYLTGAWRIAPERIAVAARELPLKPSPMQTKEGQEENQRVDITSDEYDIVKAPSVTSPTIIVNPPRLHITPYAAAEAPLSSWAMSVSSGNKLLTCFSGTDDAPLRSEERIWKITSEVVESKDDSLFVAIQLRDTLGQSLLYRKGVPIVRTEYKVAKHFSERREKAEIERFSIITFDFDKGTLSPMEARKLQHVAEAIGSDDNVHISGFTDKTGEEKHNLGLSRDRAEKTSEVLKRYLAPKHGFSPKILAKGFGVKELFDNSLPEGRFLSRTVKIEVTKSVE